MVSMPSGRWASGYVVMAAVLIAAISASQAVAQTPTPDPGPLPPLPRLSPPPTPPARVYTPPPDTAQLPKDAPKTPKTPPIPDVVPVAVEDPAGGTDHLVPQECSIGCEYAMNKGLESCDGFVDRRAAANAPKAPPVPFCRARLFEAYQRCLENCGTPHNVPRAAVSPSPPAVGP